MFKLTPFGVAIRKLRLDKGLKMMGMAEKMGLSSAFLSAIETGRKPIPDGFVVKISRALDLTADEVSALRRASDQTRREIRLDDKTEEDRELIAAFARRLDEVPVGTKEQLKKLLLKSETDEIPFERKRRGIVVPPLSTQIIRGYAEQVRNAFIPSTQISFPIIEVLEWWMPKVDPAYVFDVRDREEMGRDEGLVPVGGNELLLRIDVYEGACSGNGRDRFTATHELGHYFMHRHIRLARARSEDDKIYTDSEWQADTFAGTLLMSPRHVPSFRGPDDMAAACHTSHSAAGHMWRKYLEEKIVNLP